MELEDLLIKTKQLKVLYVEDGNGFWLQLRKQNFG